MSTLEAIRNPAPVEAAAERAGRTGMLYGLAAVAIWGLYMALARDGIGAGLEALDLVVLRHVPAGLVMLPWLLRRDPMRLDGLGWRKGVALTLLAGPLFIFLGVSGYRFAPLAHGAVLQPAAVVLITTLLAILVFKDRPGPRRWFGLAAILAGLGLVTGAGALGMDTGAATLLGDAHFVAAGACWAGFTILTRVWGVPALRATAAVVTLSLPVVLILYALYGNPANLLALPPETLVTQILVQGILSGVVAIICYTRAVETLGPARAAVFPALVPVAATLLGMPIAGEYPDAAQILGLAVVTAGLVVAMRR